MISHGYTTHLYCENDWNGSGECEDPRHYKGPGIFVAETRAETFREARSEGWRINWKTKIAICPHCVKAGKIKPKPAKGNAKGEGGG